VFSSARTLVPFGARAALVLAAGLLTASSVAADPELGTGLALGAAGVGHDAAWESTRFYGALRGDALFLRTAPDSIGFGPAVEIGTVGFSDVRFHGGVEVLFPFAEFFAVSAAPAGFVRSSSQGAVGGVSGRLLAGVRAYGYTEYSLSGGLLFGFDQDLGGPKQHAIVIGAQVDGLVLALPVLFVISALRGSHD
jgi:hypothetical protein